MVYSIVFDAFVHLASIDIAWFVKLFFGNLFWVFVFIASAYFFFNGKKTFLGFFIILIYVWAFSDVSRLTGWAFSGVLILIYFGGSIFLYAWADSDQWIAKKASVLSTLWFVSLWFGAYFLFG